MRMTALVVFGPILSSVGPARIRGKIDLEQDCALHVPVAIKLMTDGRAC
jgi:hypothetical protein